MKLFTLVLVFAFLCAGLAYAAVPTTTVYDVAEGVQIKTTLINQDPYPAEPGGMVKLNFRVENLGSTNAKDLVFEILPEYPFSLYGDSAQKDVGSIGGRQMGSLGAVVSYNLKVSEGAAEGINSVYVRYKLSNNDGVWVKPHPFNVTINAHAALLGVEKAYSEPESIAPGKTGSYYITLKNFGKSAVKDIKLRLNFSSSIPFVAINSSNERIIPLLGSDSSANLRFAVAALPGAEADYYNVPLILDFNDAGGRNYSSMSYVGMVVGSEPELLMQLDETNIYTKNSNGRVVFKFVNRGLTDIKLLTAKLLPSDDYETVSSDEVYIGKVDSDDYETAEFRIRVGDVEDKVVLPVSLEYVGADNKAYSEMYNAEIKIYSGSEARNLGLVQGSKLTGFLIILAIVALGVVLYKFWWKKRKKH